MHIREIRDPPLIGALSLRPGPLNTVRETLGGGISNGGACGLASEYTRDSKDIHEALHLVTADVPARPVGGFPKFSSPVDPPIGPPQLKEPVRGVSLVHLGRGGPETTGLEAVERCW